MNPIASWHTYPGMFPALAPVAVGPCPMFSGAGRHLLDCVWCERP